MVAIVAEAVVEAAAEVGADPAVVVVVVAVEMAITLVRNGVHLARATSKFDGCRMWLMCIVENHTRAHLVDEILLIQLNFTNLQPPLKIGP